VLSASAGSVMDTLPDCLDVGISPGVSDDVVRGTGLLMRKFAHVFGGSMRPGTWQAPPANRSQAFAVTLIHAVEPDARTHRAPPRRYSPAAHAAITAQIERWEEAGIIVPSSSPYSSALVAIRKKPVKPEDEPEYRIVVDYRWRNANALMAATPMPTVADCVARAASGKRFLKKDAWAFWHQFKVTDAVTRDHLAFTFNGKQWTFTRAPFGPRDVPSLAARFMRQTFKEANDIFYADDYVHKIESDSDSALLSALASVLTRSHEAAITWKPTKCVLFAARVRFLGYDVCDGYVCAPRDELEQLLNMRDPSSRDDLRKLVFALGTYRRFLPRLNAVLDPLLALCAPSPQVFTLGVEGRAAMAELRALLRDPVCTRPYNPDLPVKLRTDYSKGGLAYIIYQSDTHGNDVVVLCGGRRTNAYERNYSATRGEILALREAVRAHPDILGRSRFAMQWLTDNKPAITNQSSPLSPDPVVARLQMELQDTPFEAIHVSGKSTEHGLVDWLSRVQRAPPAEVALAPHPRDVGSTPDTPWRLVDRLAGLPEFAGEADRHAAAIAWLSGAPAHTAALKVWPAAASAPRPALAALWVCAVGEGDVQLEASAEIADDSSDDEVRVEPEESDESIAERLYFVRSGERGDAVGLGPPAVVPPVALLPADPHAPLARIAGGAQRNAAWRASVKADAGLQVLCAAAAADTVQRQRWPAAFFDGDGLLRVPCGAAPSAQAVLARDTGSRIVVPTARVEEVIASYHHGMFGGHFRPTEAIASVFWWATLRVDVERVRASCVQCQSFAALPPRGEAAYTGADAGRLEVVSLDLAQMPKSGSGMQYILVMIDAATGGIEAGAMQNKAAVTTWGTFRDLWLARYGVPLKVVTDNGTEFAGVEWNDGAAACGFEHTHSAPYNPRGNGMAERAVQTLKRRLEKLCVAADGRDWPLYVGQALASIRMHAGVRGASPFMLLHGVEPRLPAVARLFSGTRAASSAVAREPPMTAIDMASRVKGMLAVAQARRLARQKANATRIGQHHVERLAVGDIVLWEALTANSKFAARRHWIGPFIIMAESSFGGFFQLARPDGSYVSQRYVPARQLKLFVGDPFAADSAAILAEPGTRPWLGLDVDKSLLGERFSSVDVKVQSAVQPGAAGT